MVYHSGGRWMFGKKNKNIQPILKHTPYVGSGSSKIVHSTENPCTDAYLIAPDDRWYIKTIPEASGYFKCPKCFGEKS